MREYFQMTLTGRNLKKCVPRLMASVVDIYPLKFSKEKLIALGCLKRECCYAGMFHFPNTSYQFDDWFWTI